MTLLHDQVRKCIPLHVRRILQSNCAINTAVWKQDMEFVTGEYDEFGMVSYTGCLAYGRQEAVEISGQYVNVPKLSGCS